MVTAIRETEKMLGDGIKKFNSLKSIQEAWQEEAFEPPEAYLLEK